MALICGRCGAHLHSEAACVACRAARGEALAVPRTDSGPVVALAWLHPRAQAALESGQLSQILLAWRDVTGDLQSDVASRLGYDTSYISLLERGRRDIGGVADRRRIASLLGVPPRFLGVADPGGEDFQAMVQFGESTLRLASVARSAGRPADAINELWPLIIRLESRLLGGHVEREVVSLLARARTKLGVFLGDLLPTERLAISARWTGKALALTSRLGDMGLHASALRSHGNELRKAGNVLGAVRRLRESASLACDDRPGVLIALARAAAEAGASTLFEAAISEALRSAATQSPSPLFNANIVHEVHLRGLVQLGRLSEAARVLAGTGDESMPSAPQWKAIALITNAEVLAATGDTGEAGRVLRRALAAAKACRLPQQLQRIGRITATLPGADDLTTEARSALRDITTAAPGQSEA